MPDAPPATPTESPATPSATLDAFYASSVPSLCISVQALETSIKHGQAALWVVSAWADNGSVPGATLRVSASPAGQVAQFSFGCSGDGSAACSIGTVTSGSAARQVEARITVPTTATSVSSIRLTASASAPNLTKTPSVSAPVTVASGVSTTTPVYTSVPPSLGNIGSPVGAGGGGTTESQVPVGSFPSVGVPGTSVSPGGDASGLFPAVSPSGVTPGGGSTSADGEAAPVANTEALPIGTPVVDAQLVGLAALAVAFLLAVTRLSVRRRPAAAMAGAEGTSMALAAPAALAATPAAPAAPADAQPAGSAAEAAMPDLLGADKADPSPDIPAVRDEPPTRPEPSVTSEDDGS